MRCRSHYLAICVFSLTFACGRYQKDDDKGKESVLGFYTAASQSSLAIGDDIAFLDSDFKAIMRFKAEPLALVDAYDIPYDAPKTSFVAASEGRYYLTFKKDEFAVITSAGKTLKPTFLVDEDLTNVAFSPEHDLLVVWDDLGVVVAQLEDDGSFSKDFRGDATFGSDNAFIAATMLNDGRLVVSAGEAELLIVDLEKSIAKNAWQTTSFNLDATTGGTRAAKSMTWLAATPYDDDLLLVKDSDRVIMVNLAEKKVVDEVDLSSKTDVRVYRNNTPHLLATDNVSSSKSKSYDLYYIADDKTLKKSIISNVKDGFLDSFLGDDEGLITIRVGEEKLDDDEDSVDKQTVYKFVGAIYRYQLKSGAVKDRTDVEDKVRVHMSQDHVFLHFDSALGKLQKIDYGDDAALEEISMFNLETLRRRHH